MTRLERLRERWAGDLARLEDAYAEALESDATAPARLAQLEGMIAAYQQITRDAA